MARQKHLSLASINKQHSAEFNQVKRVTLKTGDYLDIQMKFRKTSIQRLLLDYLDILEQLKSKNVSWEVFKDATFVYYMLLLKHFTSLNNIPLEIEKMVKVCEKLIDLDLLEEILNHFDPEETKKVQDMIEKVRQNSNLIGNALSEAFVSAVVNEQNKDDSNANIQESE
jgi:hypothetical protein